MTNVKIMKATLKNGEEIGNDVLVQLYSYILENKKKNYTDDEKLKMINKKIVGEQRTNRYDLERAKRQYPNIFESDIYSWEIQEIKFDDNHGIIDWSMVTDSVESITFRGSIQLIPNSHFGSVKISLYNGKLILFLFSSYQNINYIKRAVKMILNNLNIEVKDVKWSSDSLMQIREEDSSKNLRSKVAHVEGVMTIYMNAESGLDNLATPTGIEKQGDIVTIGYFSREYDGNRININGEKGIIATDIDEKNTLNYIFNRLLSKSDF